MFKATIPVVPKLLYASKLPKDLVRNINGQREQFLLQFLWVILIYGKLRLCTVLLYDTHNWVSNIQTSIA